MNEREQEAISGRAAKKKPQPTEKSVIVKGANFIKLMCADEETVFPVHLTFIGKKESSYHRVRTNEELRGLLRCPDMKFANVVRYRKNVYSTYIDLNTEPEAYFRVPIQELEGVKHKDYLYENDLNRFYAMVN